jgi:glutamate synthase domain-containing protein 1
VAAKPICSHFDRCGRFPQTNMCGIFAYLNYGVPRTRRAIVNSLLNGLKRLEYRGYDSAGVAIDADSTDPNAITLIKQSGKVSALEAKIQAQVMRPACFNTLPLTCISTLGSGVSG